MWSIIIASVVLFGFGALWFTVLFGRTWARLMGFTEDKMSPEEKEKARSMGMVKPLVMNFLLNVVIASAVYYLYPQILALSYSEFIKLLLVMWLGFSFPIYANAAVWERKSWKLVAINSAQSLIALVLLSAVIYLMR